MNFDHDRVSRYAVPAGIFLISAAGLSYEIALTRLLSIIMWYHFAFMVISVAMLGFGASGSLLFVIRDRIRPGWNPVLIGSWGFSLSVPASLWLLHGMELDLFRLSTHHEVWAKCLVLYGLLTIPFFCLGLTIAWLLQVHIRRVSVIYGCDLLGAGAGCLLVIPSIQMLGLPVLIVLLGSLGFASSAMFMWSEGRRRSARIAAFLAIALASGSTSVGDMAIRPGPGKMLEFLSEGSQSPHRFLFRTIQKNLSQDNLSGMDPEGYWPPIHILGSYWDKLCRIDIAAYTDHHAIYGIGAASTYRGTIPGQLMISQDGDAATFITRFDGQYDKLKFIDRFLYGLPYSFKARPEVLVIGAGGGTDILAALKHDSPSVTGIELNPVTVRLVKEEFSDFAGGIYSDPRVNIIVGEGRSALKRIGKSFDIIQMTGVDTWAASSQGAYVLSENFLYTVDAFSDFYERLNDNGVLSIVRARFVRPRETLRLCSLGLEMLRKKGVRDAGSRMMVITEPTTAPNVFAGFLLKKGEWTTREIESVRRFCSVSGFEIAGGMGCRLTTPFSILLSSTDPGKIYREYPYDISPVSDDRPYFFKLHRWTQVFGSSERPSFLGIDLGARPGTGDESGLGILLLLLMQAVILASVLIGGPVFLTNRKALKSVACPLIVYFSAIGLGFMFVEIVLIQSFTLFLGYPSLSISVVLYTIFLGSGTGSLVSQKMADAGSRPLRIAAAGVAVYCLAVMLFLKTCMELVWTWPESWRIASAILIVLPLGILIGLFFPLGLRALDRRRPGSVPLAWAVNGIASVMASIISIMVSMTWGFRMVLVLALSLYVVAGVTAGFLTSDSGRR